MFALLPPLTSRRQQRSSFPLMGQTGNTRRRHLLLTSNYPHVLPSTTDGPSNSQILSPPHVVAQDVPDLV